MSLQFFHHELDWIAMDQKGQLAVFSALLHAPVPVKLKESFEHYSNVSQRVNLLPIITSAKIVLEEPGDFTSWIAYAQKGLFAFDFRDAARPIHAKNCYDLLVRPLLPLKVEDIDWPAELIDGLIKIECDFGDGDVSLKLI